MLSVIIITYNEAENIARCLEAVKWAEEIIIVDSGSTDDTVAIAKNYTSHVYVTKDWPGFGSQKNRALDYATQPWVLSIDADEVVLAALAEEINALLHQGTAYDVYQVSRQSYFIDQAIYHGDWKNDRVARLFKKDSARHSEDIVHEQLLYQVEAGRLKAKLQHYTVNTLQQAIAKMDRYSTLNAQKLMNRGKQTTFCAAFTHGVWSFLRGYFIRLGFLDGKAGFLIALLNAQGSFYKYAKLYYQQRKRATARS